MSVNIHWRPTSDKGKCFDSGTSSSWDRLQRACGTKLNESHVPKLRVMAISTDNEFYNEVADVIEKVGSIEVWGEY